MKEKKNNKITLDKQFDALPNKIEFCANCVVSNQRPRTYFNSEGVCSACQWAFEKDYIVDWASREKELEKLCDLYRRNDGRFDVVVPGSGGKDSAFVAHQLRDRYGMNPLCVTWAPFDWTNIGWKNLRNFVSKGFSNIISMPNGIIHRKLSKLAFELKGDAWEPFTFGQKSLAFHMADKYDIPLIFYGENGELEYGGTEKYKNMPKESPDEWEEHYFKGAGVDKLITIGIERGLFSENDINSEVMDLYRPISPDVIKKKKIEMHWFSYYQKWTPQENFYYCKKHTGFELNNLGRSEGTYTKYASLDDKADGFHFYLSYMKFGMGRASRDAQQDIRRKHITREEGVALVNRYDGEFPLNHFSWFLNYLDISEEFFWNVMDMYREKSNVWELKGNKWVMKYPVV
tara:strand:- start:2566 stop:3771 length:1206 start_codon:yes stop_codon:yes gene_type:complete